MTKKEGFETRLIHAGEPRPRIAGAVALPIFQSSTYEYDGEEGYHAIRYIRLNNTPNHLALHQKLASLEGAEAALVTASGMAAISTAMLAVLSHGDHILAQDCLYGGTHDFLTKDLATFGIGYDLIDGNDPDSWKQKLKPTTRAIYVESLSNPLLQVADLEAAVAFAKSHHLVSMIDNTFTSPINYRPAEHGFDLSLHSCTKYLNGHSDIVAGAVIGGAKWIERVTHKLNHLGGTLDPHACFLLHRGMKTLAVRMRAQQENAMALAEMLSEHPAVKSVNYPGLPASPSHARAKAWFDGMSAMLCVDLHGGLDDAKTVIKALTIPIHAPSLGGVESLVTLPATTSHAGMTAEDRRRAGISDSLIRISVGIESKADLLHDFEQALNRVSARG